MSKPESTQKTKVLFLCTHNSARSQMAEGLLRSLAGERFEVASAGTEATHVRPEAESVMAEVGVDISDQESKTLERYLGEPFDYVITVCDDAGESCPAFPGPARRLHWSLQDPSAAQGSEEERLAVFRQVRERIGEHIDKELLDGATLYSFRESSFSNLSILCTLDEYLSPCRPISGLDPASRRLQARARYCARLGA